MKIDKKQRNLLLQCYFFCLAGGFVIDGWTGVRIAIGAVLLTAAYGCFRSSMYEVEIEFYKKQKEDLLVAKKVQDSQRTAAVIGSC